MITISRNTVSKCPNCGGTFTPMEHRIQMCSGCNWPDFLWTTKNRFVQDPPSESANRANYQYKGQKLIKFR